MTRYVWHDGDWLPVDRWASVPGRGPNIISDDMAALKHMGDGKTYDSKSQFRRTTKALGLVELGNDAKVEPRRPAFDNTVRHDLERTYHELTQGRPAVRAGTADGTTRRYD